MPKLISDADMIYLRTSPKARALESVHESFWGMYPLTARTASFPPPTVLTRTPEDETLHPNHDFCRRIVQLSQAFGQRTADRCKPTCGLASVWHPGRLTYLGNKTKEMEYLSSLISKWMPVQKDGSHNVAVDSHPRLSGITDTVNSTLAHGPKTRLPSEFYDSKGRDIMDKIGVEE